MYFTLFTLVNLPLSRFIPTALQPFHGIPKKAQPALFCQLNDRGGQAACVSLC